MNDDEVKKQQQKKKKMMMKKKRKRHNQNKNDVVVSLNHDSLFAIIVAAICNSKSCDEDDVIKNCLNELHHSLTQNLSAPLLSLLPPLLRSKCDEVACRTAEIIGTASLTSLEMNEMIASQGDIIICLISLLKHSKLSVQMAACSAILDLSTTFTGRRRVLQFFAIETLIACLIQAPKSSFAVVSLWTDGKTGETSARIVFDKDEACTSLLHAAIVLINSCTIEQLQEIPKVLSRSVLVYLNGLWEEVHKKILFAASSTYSQDEHFYASNIRINDLAETVFRLSMNDGQIRGSSQLNKVKRRIFHLEETNYEHFVLNHWEASPLLMRDPSNVMKEDDIFSSFVQIFKSREAVHSSLPTILKTLTSCPPIASDELDILHFLEEMSLGCPLIYQQDIRVLKAHDSGMELHYFEEQSKSCSSQASQYLIMDDILKCEEAFKKGYTIALRGMEFRYKSIAAIAEELATLYGQPSAGANMYLTPPNSKGLACHRDDHCVFVCQLIGAKQWKILPPPSIQLPRLYDPVDSWHPSEVDEGGKQFLLREGDVLYIPRGFPHEAQTIINNDIPDKIAELSLHMTLAIEVEPPFEWEGFIHVALHHWIMRQNAYQNIPDRSDSPNVHLMAMKLIHVAVKLIADLDPTFRKACLVGAILSSSPLPEEWLHTNQRMIFNSLISKIYSQLNFPYALKHVETSITKDEDPFQEVRWLQHLMLEGETIVSHHWHIASADARDCFDICNQQRDTMEAAFLQVKSKFCSQVVFEDVQPSYKTLLHKYRQVRQQYTNGMLSLHCIGDKDDEPL